MPRELPPIWSAVFGVPFLASGGWLYAGQQQFPSAVGFPFIGFGLFIVVIAVYVQLVSPSPLRTDDDEEVVAVRHPTQRVALVKVAVGFPLLLLTMYLLFLTRVPYVYPTTTLVVGLYVFSKGLYTAWANSLTTYYLTTERVVREYRFLSLVRQEVPHTKVRGVQERKSLTETLVGLGNVVVASGGGSALEIRLRNMEDPGEFADRVRSLL